MAGAHVVELVPQRPPFCPRDAGPEGEGEAGRHPDRGRAADRHVPDGGGHLVVVAAAQEELLVGEPPLVEDHDRTVVPGHGGNHVRLRRRPS